MCYNYILMLPFGPMLQFWIFLSPVLLWLRLVNSLPKAYFITTILHIYLFIKFIFIYLFTLY